MVKVDFRYLRYALLSPTCLITPHPASPRGVPEGVLELGLSPRRSWTLSGCQGRLLPLACTPHHKVVAGA